MKINNCLWDKKQSTLELAKELEIGYKAASRMVKLIHGSIYTNRIYDKLRDTIEVDEIYITSGSKGSTDLGRPPRKRGLKRKGRGSWDVDKPPVIGFVRRNGGIRLEVTKNVRQETIKPLVQSYVEQGSTVYTDEYDVYNFLPASGCPHEAVNHSKGEYARGDVHVNTMEGL